MTAAKRNLADDLDKSKNGGETMEYEVEEILDESRNKAGEIIYLVKWKGYSEPNWEPEQHLTNARAKVNAFCKKKRNKPKLSSTANVQAQQDEWEVEAIRDERQTANGKAEFLVKWVGDDNLTWEPELYLENAKAKVKEFRTKRK